MIGQRRWQRTLDYVRRTGLPAEIEHMLRPTGKGGCPRDLDVDVLLAGIMFAHLERQSVALGNIHWALTDNLPDQIKTTHKLHWLKIHNIRYLWNRICDLHEDSPRRLGTIDKVEAGARQDLFRHFLDKMAAAAGEYITHTGSWAVDTTAIESAARGGRRLRRKNGTLKHRTTSRDVDGVWGYRTETHDNKSTRFFGFHLHAAVRVPTRAGEDIPLLINRIAFTRGHDTNVRHTLDIFDRLEADGVPVREVLSDRGYSHKKVENWAARLLAKGRKQVLDLHADDRGARAAKNGEGYLMIDGDAYHPAIPERLIKIRPPRMFTLDPEPPKHHREDHAKWKKQKKQLERFRADMAERSKYRYVRHGVTKNGDLRLRCPGQLALIRCEACEENFPELRFVQHASDTPFAPKDPSGAVPKACRQKTITIKAEVELKLRQEVPWGTPEWVESFSRRTLVEGTFGILKSPRSGGLRRGWTHQHGRVKTGLLIAVIVAARNFEQLLLWARRTGDISDPPHPGRRHPGPLRRGLRRRRHQHGRRQQRLGSTDSGLISPSA